MQPNEVIAYLHGAAHDGSFHRKHATYRFCQKEREWLERLKRLLTEIGFASWLYQEGKNRNLYVLETKARFLALYRSPGSFQTKAEKCSYIRGYFDAEGGIPSCPQARFYVQFVQKNQSELLELKQILAGLGIETGKLHVPSQQIDPDYFRFYVSSRSHQAYIRTIGSWHPRKQPLLLDRMKI